MTGGGVAVSFYLTYVLLITTGTITFIESLRTPIAAVRHIMNLETCISVVAAFFYGRFVQTLDAAGGGAPDYAALNRMRYTDWFITTPIMLLVLALALSYNNGKTVGVRAYGVLLALNVAMLLSGYLGDPARAAGAPGAARLTRNQALALGFAAYAALFAFVWHAFVRGSRGADNYVIFALYAGLWGLYGVAYAMDEAKKNVVYNALDAAAKCFTGIFLWAYFARVLVV